MIDRPTRECIWKLHQKGMSIGAIKRRTGLSRNTIRKVIRLEGRMPDTERKDKVRIEPELLRRLYAECDGRAQRVHERLVEEHGQTLGYSTLTQMLRELEIGKPHDARCERRPDVPGAEMQHDTSPYRIKLGGQWTKMVCSLLYLRYSKRRYLAFYPSFRRFRMKCFLHEALMYWGYAAPVCIIDNTNLARLSGTGARAVIVPEMAAFSQQHGFKFRCHEIGKPNRKAGNECSFRYVNTNFFPGRAFRDFEDLNRQAFEWATEKIYHRPVGKSRLIPAKAFEHERPCLISLPAELPAPYQPHSRVTDQYGYAAFGGNYYWVPGTRRDRVTVLEYATHIELYRHRERLASYPLPPLGVHNRLFSPPGQPAPKVRPNNRKNPTEEEQKRLRAMGAPCGDYLDFIMKAKGLQPHRLVRGLLALSGRIGKPLLLKTLERALRYQITSLRTLEDIALLCMTTTGETLPTIDIDEHLQNREAYLQGRLTDAPDFSDFEDLFDMDTDLGAHEGGAAPETGNDRKEDNDG